MKLQQSQALTWHFESFWSIVERFLVLLSSALLQIGTFAIFTFNMSFCEFMQLLIGSLKNGYCKAIKIAIVYHYKKFAKIRFFVQRLHFTLHPSFLQTMSNFYFL